MSTLVLVSSDPWVGFMVSNLESSATEVKFVVRSRNGKFLECDGVLGASGRELVELINTSTNAAIICESAKTLCASIGLDISMLLMAV
jgi:hypothetical protein